jgi:hypothetical protein
MTTQTDQTGLGWDGRYLGSNGQWWLDLRVDRNRCGVISFDLQSAGGVGRTTFVSGRTVGDVSSGLVAVDVSWVSARHGHGKGALQLEPLAGSRPPSLTFTVEPSRRGSVLGSGVRIEAVRCGDALRDLGIETEVEEGLAWPLQDTSWDGGMTVDKALEETGFRISPVGERTPLERRPGGWEGADIFATLSELMRSTAQAPLDVPAWQVHLLVLSRTTREDLLGLAFDDGGSLPRQGAAVFLDEIAEQFPANALNRKILQTVVHEIGHVLNLEHPFGRELRNSASTSFMNYDWRYGGGGRIADYWKHFLFEFGGEELVHLRHGARRDVVPGGSPFGSARYWEQAGGPQLDPGPTDLRLRLWLTPPGTTAGETAEFAFGQPVFLTVSLQNRGHDPVAVAREALDLKAGQLDIVVTRRADAPAPEGSVDPRADAAAPQAEFFVPVLRRCYGAVYATSSREELLHTGESMHCNLNLSYSTRGTSPADPGEYDVVPYLTLPSRHGGLDQVVEGESLPFVVKPADGRPPDSVDLFKDPDIGMYLALGGSGAQHLAEAHRKLADLVDRSWKTSPAAPPDPHTAVAARALGIQLARTVKTLPKPKRPAAAQRAAHLLSYAVTHANGTPSPFDPHTLEHTRRLAASHQVTAGLAGSRPAPRVVVALQTVHADGTRGEGGTAPGILIVSAAKDAAGNPSQRFGRGWAVLAPAHMLPDEVMNDGVTVHAEVVVATEEGLTERISVTRLDLIGAQQGGGPQVAMLRLGHDVPASPMEEAPDAAQYAKNDLWGLLGSETTVARADLEPGAQLETWAWAAYGASPDMAALPSPSETHRHRPDFDDVAGWRCFLTSRCDGDQPPDVQPPWSGGVPRSPRPGGGPAFPRARGSAKAAAGDETPTQSAT